MDEILYLIFKISGGKIQQLNGEMLVYLSVGYQLRQTVGYYLVIVSIIPVIELGICGKLDGQEYERLVFLLSHLEWELCLSDTGWGNEGEGQILARVYF